MKKFRNTLIGTILAGVLASIGCSSNDNNNTDPNTTIEPEVPVVSDSTRQELTESLFEHYGTLTKEQESHLLQDSTVMSHNQEDPDTPVTGVQTLDFGSLTPRFAKDNLGDIDVFLHSKHSERLYTWKLGFDSGVQSRINSDGKLIDLIQQDINICGKNYRITDAEVAFLGTDVDEVSLDLITSKAAFPLDVGYFSNVVVDGLIYEVEILGTTLNTDGSYSGQLRVNGETTPDMNIGDVYQLADGQFVGIYWTDNDTVEFGLGAQKLSLTDNNINDEDYADTVSGDGIFGYHSPGRDARVRIKGSVSADQLITLSQLAYRLFANMQSQTDIYVDAGHGLDEHLDQPGASLINVGFNGLKTKTDDGKGNMLNRLYSNMEFTYATTATGSSYSLTFINKEGTTYTDVEFIENAGTSATDRVLQQKLVMKEASSQTDYNIHSGDTFVLTTELGRTFVFEYTGLKGDETEGYTIDLLDKSGTITQEVVVDATGRANIQRGGNTFEAYVDIATGNMAVDQNGDGAFDGADIPIMDQYGAKLTVPSATQHVVTANVSTSADKIDGKSVDEVVDLEFCMAGSGMDVTLPQNPRMYQGVGRWQGQTRYGVRTTLKDDRDVALSYPEIQEEPWTLLAEKGN